MFMTCIFNNVFFFSPFQTSAITQCTIKDMMPGVPCSSVGRARAPCAEALQRTRIRLPVRVPLLRVTPRLSLPLFPVISSSLPVNKAIKRPKRYDAYKHSVKTGLQEANDGHRC